MADAELLLVWSEAEFGKATLERAVAPGAGRVVGSDEVPALLASLPDADGSAEVVEQITAEEVVLVHGYHKCQLQRPHADRRGGTVWFAVVEEDEQIACAWSPYTVELWSVPVSAVGRDEPRVVHSPA